MQRIIDYKRTPTGLNTFGHVTDFATTVFGRKGATTVARKCSNMKQWLEGVSL